MINKIIPLSILLTLVGCSSSNMEITSVGQAKPNSLIVYSEEVKKQCNDFNFNTTNKNIFLEFDASPTTTERLKGDLENQLKLTSNKDSADLNFNIKSEFAAVRPINSRFARFEQIGTYIEDTNKTIKTERVNKNYGMNVDLQFLNPIAFAVGNIVRGINYQRTDGWVQGKGRDPDGKCLKSRFNSCEHWEYIHELKTTITEVKSGKTCIIESQAKDMKIKPELLIEQHINLVEQQLTQK